ncbi:hypothetical protein ACUC2M_15535 [Bacillus cytotoxicus]
MKTQEYSLLTEYNDTSEVFEFFRLDELLKNSSERFGNKTAIIDKDQEITYKTFYEEVSQLATEITCENQPVGIIARRSIQSVIQIFAVVAGRKLLYSNRPELSSGKNRLYCS